MIARIFLVAFAIAVALAPREPWQGRARMHVASARALATSGTLDVAFDPALADTTVKGGRRYANAPLLPTLLLSPVELALLPLPQGETWARVRLAVESMVPAALAALLVALFFVSQKRLGASPRAALGGCAMLLFATTILPAARVPDGSVLAALLLLGAVEAARRRRAGELGLLAAGLALTDLMLVPAALVLGGFVALKDGSQGAARRTALALLPLVAAAAVAIAHLAFIGAAPPAAGDRLHGLYGLLLSTGKSVFVYSPPLALIFVAMQHWWRARRLDAALLLATAAAVLIPAAGLERWHGDPAWGAPRALPLVPVLLAPISLWLVEASRRAKQVAAALAAAGLVVQLLGLALAPEVYLRVASIVKNNTSGAGWFAAAPDQCHFIPQFSPVVGHAWLLSKKARGDRKLEIDPPWKLLLASTPRLDGEWANLRINWFALAWPPLAAAGWLLFASVAVVAGALGIRRRLVVP